MIKNRIEIDTDAVLLDLHSLREIGQDRTGVSRPAFSKADMAARNWVAAQMRTMGLEVATDGVGNVVGRDPDAQRTLLLGSHSDSVPSGGWLDGALGVVYALNAARSWRRANGSENGFGIDVVAFADEEGTFLGCLGSRAFCGELDAAAMDKASSGGTPLRHALREAGLQGALSRQIDPARHMAYLEAHIEQGPILEAGHSDIGVVTGIVGMRRLRISFQGRADHAGTTPMAMRQDAGAAMFAFAVRVSETLGQAALASTVWNIGIAGVSPGAANVVPALAEMVLEYRDMDDSHLDRLTAIIHDLLRQADGRQGVAVRAEAAGGQRPAPMDAKLIACLEHAAATCGASARRMTSGAGHDAMILASHIPAGMMFVPSIGGRSHDVTENTAEVDIRRGAEVFAMTAFGILAAGGL